MSPADLIDIAVMSAVRPQRGQAHEMARERILGKGSRTSSDDRLMV